MEAPSSSHFCYYRQLPCVSIVSSNVFKLGKIGNLLGNKSRKRVNLFVELFGTLSISEKYIIFCSKKYKIILLVKVHYYFILSLKI